MLVRRAAEYGVSVEGAVKVDMKAVMVGGRNDLVIVTTLPWSHRLCTDSNTPVNLHFARGPKRTSALEATNAGSSNRIAPGRRKTKRHPRLS